MSLIRVAWAENTQPACTQSINRLRLNAKTAETCMVYDGMAYLLLNRCIGIARHTKNSLTNPEHCRRLKNIPSLHCFI